MDNEKNNENISDSDSFVDTSRIYKKKGKRRMRVMTALVIVAVILFNAVFSVLAYNGLWIVDQTKTRYKTIENRLYTLDEQAEELLRTEMIPAVDAVNAQRTAQGDEPLKVGIIFCSEPDLIEGNEYMRYVQYTARAMQRKFSDHIEVKYINGTKNPTELQKYKVNSASTIYDSNVIIEFGTEYTVHAWRSFYTSNSDSEDPWAYNGEKKLAASILSVTRAESPICCITYNHGETIFDDKGAIREEYTSFVDIIESAGYLVQHLDLERDTIPEDCRMILTFNPQEDFKAFGNLGENGISEIEKLNKYLDMAYTFFYICDRETPELKNLEEYLVEWGIVQSRIASAADDDDNFEVRDTASIDTAGNFIMAEYASHGLGASITSDMRSFAYPSKVIFGNSTAISPSETFKKTYNKLDDEDPNSEVFVTYNYNKNGVVRYMYDVFTTSATAYVNAPNGDKHEVATDETRFKLMTITQETRTRQEGNYQTVNEATYVLALASTDFVKNDILNSSAYGNTDVLLSALRATSKEVIPVTIEFEPFYIYDIDETLAASIDYRYLILVAALPVIAITVCGIVICVRRKYK